ncbi:hypothetical protein SAMN05444149_102543 [Pseudosulfitobacter pseudonitzschiae]|nr:hypothetical protein [Pseudosulfitobacter pseudonitzschiae]QKS09667.1 hypothetical protein HT745_14860 [Pseudosulfitobacter pseudonitzschiae]SHE99876.1 hypothetical protein SAMN05444149_102543 [Pseudosulfitobacter pseudonitzschiae]
MRLTADDHRKFAKDGVLVLDHAGTAAKGDAKLDKGCVGLDGALSLAVKAGGAVTFYVLTPRNPSNVFRWPSDARGGA